MRELMERNLVVKGARGGALEERHIRDDFCEEIYERASEERIDTT